MPKKIAFLFLIYDTIHHEDLWNDFFLQDTENRHSIYIHYKYNTPLKHFEKNKLDACVETKWGHISIVKAQNVLLEKSLDDPDNEMFVFCSNSCIPLKKFDHIYKSLDTNFSYFNVDNDLKWLPRCNKAAQSINKKLIQKASQWCILNRKHAKLICESNEYLKWFDDTYGDEHCYITYLNYKGLMSETIRTNNSAENATTFTNWPDMNYFHKNPADAGRGTLKTYDTICDEELLYLYHSKCFFGRKFSQKCDLKYLRKLLFGSNGGESTK